LSLFAADKVSYGTYCGFKQRLPTAVRSCQPQSGFSDAGGFTFNETEKSGNTQTVKREKTNKIQKSDVYYQLLSQHVSGIITPIFRRTKTVCYCIWCTALVLLDVVGSGCGALRCRMSYFFYNLLGLLFEDSYVVCCVLGDKLFSVYFYNASSFSGSM